MSYLVFKFVLDYLVNTILPYLKNSILPYLENNIFPNEFGDYAPFLELVCGIHIAVGVWDELIQYIDRKSQTTANYLTEGEGQKAIERFKKWGKGIGLTVGFITTCFLIFIDDSVQLSWKIGISSSIILVLPITILIVSIELFYGNKKLWQIAPKKDINESIGEFDQSFDEEKNIVIDSSINKIPDGPVSSAPPT